MYKGFWFVPSTSLPLTEPCANDEAENKRPATTVSKYKKCLISGLDTISIITSNR